MEIEIIEKKRLPKWSIDVVVWMASMIILIIVFNMCWSSIKGMPESTIQQFNELMNTESGSQLLGLLAVSMLSILGIAIVMMSGLMKLINKLDSQWMQRRKRQG